tara:strand:- start:42 stop:407 length:366 start_codon:yes stop_codon:yes gene_type:complete
MLDNIYLGEAVEAYVKQTLGESQRGIGYECRNDSPDIPNSIRLYWNRAEAEPTDVELEAAFHIYNWERVREERNRLLAETDFYANTDVTMTADMTTYRQALRDLPASTAKSEDVVWPTKPS